jgi:hypothetical protein
LWKFKVLIKKVFEMTEENENDRMKMHISIDRSAEVDSLNQELAKTKLELENYKNEKQILEGKKAPIYKGAELNSQQLGLDDEQSIFGADLPIDLWQLSSEQELKEKINEAIEGKFGADRKTEAINFNKQLREQTARVAQIRGLEYELESKPMNRFEFQGMGKPARVLSNEEMKKNKPKMIPVKKAVEQP